MSRPRINPEEAAREAFKMEVKVQRVYRDMKQSELADEIGVVPSVMSNLLANPDKISAGRLRKIIRALSLDPTVILAFLGYTAKEIQNISKST